MLETLHVISDIDDVLAQTGPRIIHEANETLKKSLRLANLTDDFAGMLGLSHEDACEWWLDACPRIFAEVEPTPGAQAAVAHVSRFALIDSLTGRRPQFREVTASWIRPNFPQIRDICHAEIPWATDPKAHLRTKAEDFQRMGGNVFWEDQLRNCLAVAELGAFTILVDHYNSHKHTELPPNVVRATCMDQTAELTEAYATRRAALIGVQ